MEEITKKQRALIDCLRQEELLEIDTALMTNTSSNWRKIARVVGTTMTQLKPKYNGIPDMFYGQRIAGLISQGKLLSQGDIKKMHFSEIRVP
ncbi:MAG: DUF3658 domain-containing protein [Cellvibrionaceae bacterium]